MRARSGVIVGVKPSRHQHVDRVALQGQLEQHGFVLEEVEAVARRPSRRLRNRSGPSFSPSFDVVERLEVELGRSAFAAADFQVRLIVSPDRRVGMRQVGN